MTAKSRVRTIKTPVSRVDAISPFFFVICYLIKPKARTTTFGQTRFVYGTIVVTFACTDNISPFSRVHVKEIELKYIQDNNSEKCTFVNH